jgi:hypothetical protein
MLSLSRTPVMVDYDQGHNLAMLLRMPQIYINGNGYLRAWSPSRLSTISTITAYQASPVPRVTSTLRQQWSPTTFTEDYGWSHHDQV